ncbi:MAG: hypothetical protein WAX33_04345 [Rectinemataceae bacterium]
MEITKESIAKVVRQGNWLIRADNDGISPSGEAKGFRWSPIGEWTEAPDWNPGHKCGGGLHGQDINYGGMISGTRLVFCETSGKHIKIDGYKVKVKKARILLVNALPDGLSVGGDLHLTGTGITALPDGLSVGGDLRLTGTGITALPGRITVLGGRIIRS